MAGDFAPDAFLIKRVDAKFKALEREYPSYVYVVRWGEDGPVKIGCTEKPSARLLQLQHANWGKLHLVAVVAVLACGAVEQGAHEIARAHRIRGEWFDLEPLEAVQAILASAEMLGKVAKPVAEMVASLVPERPYADRTFVMERDVSRREVMRRKMGLV